jgi:hypothetical protein
LLQFCMLLALLYGEDRVGTNHFGVGLNIWRSVGTAGELGVAKTTDHRKIASRSDTSAHCRRAAARGR